MKPAQPIFFVLFLLSASVIKSQTAGEIIDRYIQFTGGAENWKAVNTIITSGNYNYGGVAFPYIAYSKRPNLYLYVVTYNGRSFSQAYNGQVGWQIDGFKNEKAKTILKDKKAISLANEADVELESPFINYRQKGFSPELLGTDSVNSRLCHKIRLVTNGDTAVYYFDNADFSLIKKQAPSKNSEMNRAPMDIFYSDYKQAGIIKIPHKINCTTEGQQILLVTVDGVKLNEPMTDTQFQP